MGEAAYQIPLDLGHRTALGREDFLVTASNHDAVAWVDLWPDWPAPVLVIYGDVASGKSHLASVWRDMSGAAFVTSKDMETKTVEEISEISKNLIMDDADSFIGNQEQERKLFHLYNMFREEGRSILITMKDVPVHKAFSLPDLASRLRAAPAVSMGTPDESLITALLVKMFADRQLKVNADVIKYIVPRIERTFRAARNIVEQADNLAMREKRPISIPLIRQIIQSGTMQD